MVPGCTKPVLGFDEYDESHTELCRWDVDELYPDHEYRLDAVPSDIRDWVVHRRYLVDTWKSSYEEFLHRFTRYETCGSDLYYGRP